MIISFAIYLDLYIIYSISASLTYSLSDHLPQICILPKFFSNLSLSKHNIVFYDWLKFNQEQFIEDYNQINWNEILQTNTDDGNITFNNYLDKINSLIHTHVPLKKLNKQQQRKFHEKPWIRPGIQTSIKKKNKLFKKYIKCNNPNKKIET